MTHETICLLLSIHAEERKVSHQDPLWNRLNVLVGNGLIEVQNLQSNWAVTVKGITYIRFLTEVPLPEPRWVDPRTEQK